MVFMSGIRDLPYVKPTLSVSLVIPITIHNNFYIRSHTLTAPPRGALRILLFPFIPTNSYFGKMWLRKLTFGSAIYYNE